MRKIGRQGGDLRLGYVRKKAIRAALNRILQSRIRQSERNLKEKIMTKLALR